MLVEVGQGDEKAKPVKAKQADVDITNDVPDMKLKSNIFRVGVEVSL